ncbi:MAG: hypothetical protein KKG92_02635 [Gammaproteobacteria bacterium]|nr:hypothetical protein [Gammaproteobacteria bacterium]
MSKNKDMDIAGQSGGPVREHGNEWDIIADKVEKGVANKREKRIFDEANYLADSIKEISNNIKQLNLTSDELVFMASLAIAFAGYQENLIDRLEKLKTGFLIQQTAESDARNIKIRDGLIKMAELGAKLQKRNQARVAAIALHSKPGGSHEKQEAIRARWATGNFSTRDICADEESSAIPMSRKSARNALIGTPDPDPWPAKSARKYK